MFTGLFGKNLIGSLFSEQEPQPVFKKFYEQRRKGRPIKLFTLNTRTMAIRIAAQLI
jgi:hypothetical protein